MARESANQLIRQMRALYAMGPVAGLTDAELIESFLRRDGAEREDAFAALVQRHGPMVLRICRRMLGGSADAEDAFQAVFLVLARKAGALRRVDGLKSWLYGVAVRTAKEARRRSAKRTAREGGAMDESRAVYAPDQGQHDLVCVVHEEIDRLPSRYRDPLLLCELEGALREDAARQLRVLEGTLSSRLSRGRSLLRDRLTRRGVASGAGAIAALLSERSSAAVSGPLADATVSYALNFSARAAASAVVPTAVASLASGVLEMISAAKLKLILTSTAALGAAICLTAGIGWAFGSRQKARSPQANEPPAITATKESADAIQSTSPQILVRGVVVDEAGSPVAGAEIRANPFSRHEARGVSDSNGSFAIALRRERVDGTYLLARAASSDRLGFFRYEFNLTPAAAEAPARIVLKPPRPVEVRVTDATKAPVAGAAVEAAGNFAVLDDRATGPDGSARLLIPADAKVEWVVALKSGRGFDYAEFGPIDELQQSKGGAPATEMPASVVLTLDGARTAQFKAIDRAGKPLANIGFYPWLLHKAGRRSSVNFSTRIFVAETGRDGIATFDWLPATNEDLTFFPASEGYAQRRAILKEGDGGMVTARLTRTEVIRGRVVRPGGSPAPGIQVRAFGSGQGIDHGQAQARTAGDGSYEMHVSAGEAYAVYVDDESWAAPARLDVVVREGKPADAVDFQLTRGTVIRGTVTVGPGNQPVANQFIRLDETGGQAPDDLREEGDRLSRQIRRQFGAMTDAAGRYSIRVGPGTYTVGGPPRTRDEKIKINDQTELVRDFQMPRPEKGTLAGRVVLPGAQQPGLAGANVAIAPVSTLSGPFAVTADGLGRFHAERPLDRLLVCATSPDGKLGAVVEVGAEDPEATIVVAPTATASGVILDDSGHPAANEKLEWGRRVFLDETQTLSMMCFAPKVVTDSEGRFHLPSLVVGQEYEITLLRKNAYLAAAAVRPEKAGSIDLGTIRAGAYQQKALVRAEDESSFRTDAPGAGTVAPPLEATTLDGKPLTLGDFKERFVLLDFWATWCGPCIAEIPNLRSVYDAFRNDQRFAILSLSVDEKIETPTKFQEKRQLPWSQGFLGGGIRGATYNAFGIRAIPAFVLIGPDGRIIARGMRGGDIKKAVAKALAKTL